MHIYVVEVPFTEEEMNRLNVAEFEENMEDSIKLFRILSEGCYSSDLFRFASDFGAIMNILADSLHHIRNMPQEERLAMVQSILSYAESRA